MPVMDVCDVLSKFNLMDWILGSVHFQPLVAPLTYDVLKFVRAGLTAAEPFPKESVVHFQYLKNPAAVFLVRSSAAEE